MTFEPVDLGCADSPQGGGDSIMVLSEQPERNPAELERGQCILSLSLSSFPFLSRLGSELVSTACHHQPLTDGMGDGMGQGTRIYMTSYSRTRASFSFTYTGLGIQDRIMRQQPMGNAPRASDVVRKYLPQEQPGQGWCHG